MEEAVKAQWSSNERKDDLHFFPLEGLLPAGQALSVNTAYLIISLVSTNSVSGNPILLQRPMTELQMRLLLPRSEEHTSELQSHSDLVCRLLLEKKKRKPHVPMLPT